MGKIIETKTDRIRRLEAEKRILIAENAKLRADLDYVAIMTDVDIDDEEENENE